MPKRLLAAVVTLPLLLSVTATASVITSPTSTPCAITRGPSETKRHLVRRRIACAVHRFGPVAGGSTRAICIAKRESGLDPAATSATGKYRGLYQHSSTLWPDRYDRWTKAAWRLRHRALNGRSNSIVTIRMVHGMGGWKAAGWPVKGC